MGIFEMRIGQGFDSHRFIKGRPLILGGIIIPSEFGLDGHSDADVLTHAIIDSLLGALSIGNIGSWFPDNDSKYKNADSLFLLKSVKESPLFEGWSISNLDATVILERPKLISYVPDIQNKIAETLGITPSCVSVKPKTAEKMGFCGRGEGVVALVNCLLART